MHDPSLKRLAGTDGYISDYTLRELRKLKIGGTERIPTLEEVFRWAKPNMMGVYVELKSTGTDAAVAELIRDMEMGPYVVVGSFDKGLLREFKKRMPEVYTSVLFHEVGVDPISMAMETEADFVHPCWENEGNRPDELLDNFWVEGVHGAGLGVIAWHEERPAVVRALYHLGVDGICSNRPDILYRLR